MNSLTNPTALKDTTGILTRLASLFRSMFAKFLLNPDMAKKKRTWVAAAILLRLLYVFIHEYGLRPFKKSLQNDHVFLTGAAGGIGRLMAVKFAQLGCKLSLSDVDMAGLAETKRLCEEASSQHPVCTFECDVSDRKAI